MKQNTPEFQDPAIWDALSKIVQSGEILTEDSDPTGDPIVDAASKILKRSNSTDKELLECINEELSEGKDEFIVSRDNDHLYPEEYGIKIRDKTDVEITVEEILNTVKEQFMAEINIFSENPSDMSIKDLFPSGSRTIFELMNANMVYLERDLEKKEYKEFSTNSPCDNFAKMDEQLNKLMVTSILYRLYNKNLLD